MKKVLIITYYWPPAGGPGVQRWLKFVKYLKDFNVEPVVYIPKDPHYPLIDSSLMKEVPDDVTILQQKIIEPYALSKLISRKQTSTISSGIISDQEKQSWLQKFMLFVRGNFFIPDARKFWIKPSVDFLTDYLQENKIDTVITTGPPHSLHLIGRELRVILNIIWIADFRDPWTNIGYHKKLKLTTSSQKKHVELEQEVLTTADQIITTSYTTAEEFRNQTHKPVSVITNGYDFSEVTGTKRDVKFTIAHIGSLLSGRDPENLWKILGELVVENKDFSNNFILKLTGAVSEEVLSSINRAGLKNHLHLQKYVSHPEALKIQRSSQLLLLVEINSKETRGIIPGKLFEYLAAGRPVLAVGPEDWDVRNILEETGAGAIFTYSDEKKLKQQIQEYYRLYKENGLEVSTSGIEKYSRRNLTGQLAKIIKKEWE